MQPDPAMNKLPKWAREEILSLRRSVHSAKILLTIIRRDAAMSYSLSYVNLPDGTTVNYDRFYAELGSIEDFVSRTHPDASSYQIIVVRNGSN